MNQIITKQLDKIVNLCHDNKVQRLFAFGSVVGEKFNAETSDIDLLVEVNEPDPLKKGDYLLNLWDGFEALFKRKVDLLTPNSIRNPILKEVIEETKVLVYEA